MKVCVPKLASISVKNYAQINVPGSAIQHVEQDVTTGARTDVLAATVHVKHIVLARMICMDVPDVVLVVDVLRHVNLIAIRIASIKVVDPCAVLIPLEHVPTTVVSHVYLRHVLHSVLINVPTCVQHVSTLAVLDAVIAQAHVRLDVNLNVILHVLLHASIRVKQTVFNHVPKNAGPARASAILASVCVLEFAV